jgi:hypothetical protein
MTTKSYLLVRDFDNAPDDAIQLGHVLSDPLDPLFSLNADDRLEVPSPILKTSSKTGFTATRGQVRDGKFGIWAQILEGTTFGGSVNFSHIKNDTYTIEKVDTSFMWLAPAAAKSYIQQSVDLMGVKRFLAAGRFRKPVYMITGIKVARGVSVNCEDKGEKGGTVKAMVDGTGMGIPLKAGPEAEVSSKKVKDTAFEGSDDFVFAYQLRKITCSKKKPLKDEGYAKGAMFDAGSTESKAGLPLEISVAGEDVVGGDVGAQVISFDDEIDGEDDCFAIVK